MASTKHTVCLMAGPHQTHVDACFGNANKWSSCDQTDQTCANRVKTNAMGAKAVKLADQYDRSLMPKHAPCMLVTCSKQFTKETGHMTVPTDDTPHEHFERPQELGRRTDCGEHGHMVGQRQLFNLLGQPVSWDAWQKSLHKKPISNNDRNFNVVGQRIHRIPMPPKPESLLPSVVHIRPKGPLDFNVMGQKISPIVLPKKLSDVCTDRRPYNVIGQPLKALPPIVKKKKPVPLACRATAFAL